MFMPFHTQSSPVFMFIAGDPSGDQNTAPIIAQIKKEIPQCSCIGIGGPRMQAQGFISLFPFGKFNRMGYIDALTHIPFFIHARKVLIEEMKKSSPSVLVCVDYSGFNTPMMKAACNLGIPVVWYIAPKFWAWKKKKHTTNLKKYAHHVAVIFPFEAELLAKYVNRVTFVGNPLVENNTNRPELYTQRLKDDDLRKKDIIRLALVPGSRTHEITFMLPAFVKAYKILKQRYPSVVAHVSRCPYIAQTYYSDYMNDKELTFFDGTLEDMFLRSDIALVTSGTATLQTALMGVPMVIAYKTNYLNYCIIRSLTYKTVTFIGLPNIIAGRSLVPECIQKEADPAFLARTLQKFIESPELYKKTIHDLLQLRNNLGSKSPSKEVTSIILNSARQ